MTRDDRVDACDGSALSTCRWLRRCPLRPSVSRLYLTTKRTLDIVVAAVGLLVSLPIVVLAAIAIKLESPRGPVFFAQTRAGYAGRPFRLYKLRTMVPNAEQLKHELLHLNTRQWPDFKVDHDPRLLRVGRILRASSIDELPQLFNVLCGNMTLVGPRPTSLAADGFRRWQQERFEVKPGVTGLWQVYGRGEPSFDYRARLDIAYVKRRGVALDLRILCLTVSAVVRGRGAY